PPRYPPAGAHDDDGHGELAQASIRFLTSEHTGDGDPPAAPRPAPPPPPDDDDDDDPDAAAGAGLAAGAYGGALYADHVVPPWPALRVDRRPRYRQTDGLSGAVEGAVTWRGVVPGTLTTACGPIEPVAAGAGRALAGVLVYIEKVSVGRTLPGEGKPASVGGLVVKRGCALVPAVQIATPLPAALTVHGDGRRARLRVTPPSGAARVHELEEAGRASLQLQPGVTRVEADDGALAAAWIVAADTPYYALTDDHGRFRLDELAPGTYDVTFWHPAVPSLVNGALTYGPPIVVRRAVQVDAARTSRLDVAIGP
ncbi:MAG TPA: carboxypeptidase-like regulatory domain-containing protein, partial [Kofleriaceae bacterium]|nr:carboxypeptidase-like regulatory domain-containing protein [Kofleriaceae bacterium]